MTIEADIIKQKLPENNGGYNALNFGKTHKAVYSQLTSDNPIDLTRYQVANCYMGRAGLINSGGASAGESDLKEAVKTAVINKRAGGMGLISGRKAFQRPMKEGVGAAQRDSGRLSPRDQCHDFLLSGLTIAGPNYYSSSPCVLQKPTCSSEGGVAGNITASSPSSSNTSAPPSMVAT